GSPASGRSAGPPSGPGSTPAPGPPTASSGRRSWGALWRGSWGVVVLHTRTSGGSGALLLFDQCAPWHRLQVLEEFPAHLGHARIRGARRIQPVHDPTYEGL